MAKSTSLQTPPQRVTLKEVARAAGLSQSTVSLALNRRTDCHLSEATRRRAIQVARELGYRPNWRAQALARKQTFTIGLVYARRAPFMSAVNEAIISALAETFNAAGYYQLLVSTATADPDSWQDVIRPDRLDGCVVLNPMPVEFGQILREAHLPMVLCNLISDLPVPQVAADDRNGMQQLMNHLLDLGHKRITFLYRARHPHYSVLHRRETYEQVMQQMGLGQYVCVRNDETVDPFIEDFVSGRNRPTAVICHDHVMAVYVRHACWKRGIRIPEDISLACFNDVFPIEAMTPPITCISLPGDQIGRMAADMLLERIARKQREPSYISTGPERKWVPEHLVVRESTSAPRKEG